MNHGRILALALALALPASLASWGAASAASATAQAPTAAAPAKAPPAAKAPLIDINTASEAELDAVPQIGPARAKAIIAGRPYKAKDELVSKKIVSQSVYEKIRDKIIAKQ
jgi:competence protein ComEA